MFNSVYAQVFGKPAKPKQRISKKTSDSAANASDIRIDNEETNSLLHDNHNE